MHTLYDNRRPPETVRPGEGRSSRMLAKVATLTYWIPLLTVDLWIFTRGGLRAEGLIRAGDLLFKETVVYLGFWMLVAVIQGLLFSRRRDRGGGKRAKAWRESAKLGNASLNRERTGL